jgi:hypothetical protein
VGVAQGAVFTQSSAAQGTSCQTLSIGYVHNGDVIGCVPSLQPSPMGIALGFACTD